MKIAIDARIINSSTGTYIAKLLEYLQSIDTQNEYIVLLREKDTAYWKPSVVNFTTKVAEFDNFSFAEQIGFKKFLDGLSADLVHFCMPQQPILYSGKKVTTVHDLTLLTTYNSDKNWLIFHAKQLVGRYVFKRIAATNDHIITVSNTTKNDFQNFTNINDDAISVIYEAAEHHAPTLTPHKNLLFDNFIMYVGQQPDYKNLRRLILAHQKMIKTLPSLGLVLVGRMNPDTLRNKAWVEKNGYKNVQFTGFIENAERDWLFSKTKAYIFPSLKEGFGLPPLEAMASGAPVVSSSASCMPEILGEAAMYFDPFSVDDIAEKTLAVIVNDSVRNELVERGHKQVGKYSWRRMAEETHAVYMKVLS